MRAVPPSGRRRHTTRIHHYCTYLAWRSPPGKTIVNHLLCGRSRKSLNPYAAVIRKHVTNYFVSGVRSPYAGLWEIGIKTYHHHRTLEEYLDAFLIHGLRLTKLADLTGRAIVGEPDSILPEGYLFPRFMLVAFSKPE